MFAVLANTLRKTPATPSSHEYARVRRAVNRPKLSGTALWFEPDAYSRRYLADGRT